MCRFGLHPVHPLSTPLLALCLASHLFNVLCSPNTHTIPRSVPQGSQPNLWVFTPPPRPPLAILTSPVPPYSAWGLDVVVLLVPLLCLLWRWKPGPHSILHSVSSSAWEPALPRPGYPDPALWAAAVSTAARDLLLGTMGTLFS